MAGGRLLLGTGVAPGQRDAPEAHDPGIGETVPPWLSLSDRLWQGMAPLGANHRRGSRGPAEVEWQAAIAALGDWLATLPQGAPGQPRAVVISGPLPMIPLPAHQPDIVPWVMTPQPLATALNGPRSLLPAATALPPSLSYPLQALPLPLNHPLLGERFCFVFSASVSLVMVMGQPQGAGWRCQYSFEPAVVQAGWQGIWTALTPSPWGQQLQAQVQAYPPPTPAQNWAMAFTQTLMAHLPHRQGSAPPHQGGIPDGSWPEDPTPGTDTELLQAMAHEIRTPLTTIRTLTRSLLRRGDLGGQVSQRLHRIDQECTQQIDRFNLIFRAAELTSVPGDRRQSPLSSIPLGQIFEAAIPQWQQQAHRRDLALTVNVPPRLPMVFSDPTLLHQVLTGVVEWLTQGLPAHSQIQLRVTLAGPQLKLQFLTRPGPHPGPRPAPRSLGQLLTVAPDTGGLSLSLEVTKALFQAMGGKLTVRQRPTQGDIVTVYLPLDLSLDILEV